jgi:hypothetical protein
MDKACKNCEYWDRLPVCETGARDVDVCTKIEVYMYDPNEQFPRLAITEPDFYCPYFAPKIGE